MKKIITIITTILLFTSIFSVALAVDPLSDRLTNVGQAAGFSESVGETSIATTVGGIIKTFLSLLGIIFMAYTVYAGFLWMTASGEEEKIKKAKVILRGSIIGLVIALSGYIITATVVDRLTTATSYDTAYLLITPWV